MKRTFLLFNLTIFLEELLFMQFTKWNFESEMPDLKKKTINIEVPRNFNVSCTLYVSLPRSPGPRCFEASAKRPRTKSPKR